MIELKHICKSFGDKAILQDLNISIYPDELTFIVGTSGAGKTTLLNIIGGLSKPTSGKMVVDGKDVLKSLSQYRADAVGFIFQDFNLISGLSVKDNVLLGQYLAGTADISGSSKIADLLAGVGLKQIQQKAETLSGGEKQRTAFARSVLKESRVIIADEPTGNLDSDNADKVLEILAQNKKGRHVIVVTHDMEKAQKYADRIVTIKDGKIFSDTRTGDGQYTAENSIETKPHNFLSKWKAIHILGRNSIRRRWGKILSTVLVIALAISALTMVINIRGWGNFVTTRVNKYYLETDLIGLVFPKGKAKLYQDTAYPFSETDLQDISGRFPGATMVTEYFSSLDSSFLIGSGSIVVEADLKQIQLNPQFEERIMSYEIEGRFLQNDDEIIIASTVAKEVFSGAGIGEKITLFSGEGTSKEYTVVGINNTVNPFDSIYTIVCADSLKSMKEEEIQERLDGMFVLSEKTESGFSAEGLRGTLVVGSDAENVLAGHLPQSKEEFAISSFQAENAFGKDWKEHTEELFSKDYWLDLNGRWTIHICGVIESENMCLLCSPFLIEDIREADPVAVDVYLPDNIDTAQAFEDINTEGKYFCTYSLEKLKNQVGDQTDFFMISIMVVGIILTLISVALLNSFSKITVLERKRELGIIKSLGADNKDLMAVLLYDSIVMAISSFVLSLGLTWVANLVLKKVFGSMGYIQFAYPWGIEFAMGGGFILLILLCTAIHFIKVARLSPSELLTDR